MDFPDELLRQVKKMNRMKTLNCREMFVVTGVLLAASAIPGCSMISDDSKSSLPERPASERVESREISHSVTTANVQRGAASWYGPGFHGKTTASGEVFDEAKFTAAHKTLPLGSKAMVINVSNGRSVEVLINDRGPHVQGRIIDLSQASAQALGMIDQGVVDVQVELIQETVASANSPSANRR